MGKIDHSAAGAIHAVQKNAGVGKILAYLIAGHHAGLPDWEHEAGVGGALSDRLSSVENLQKALNGNPPQEILDVSLPSSRPCNTAFKDYDAVHVWLRMLYSCLVDADFLDTEAFMNPDKTDSRTSACTLEGLKDVFDLFMKEMQEKAQTSPVNEARKAILDDCRNKAELE